MCNVCGDWDCTRCCEFKDKIGCDECSKVHCPTRETD